jgi:hypothetical protein
VEYSSAEELWAKSGNAKEKCAIEDQIASPYLQPTEMPGDEARYLLTLSEVKWVYT